MLLTAKNIAENGINMCEKSFCLWNYLNYNIEWERMQNSPWKVAPTFRSGTQMYDFAGNYKKMHEVEKS